MNQFCFFNGEIVPLTEAKISILDIGLLRGYGVYDGLAVINAKPLRFDDHWQRFVLGTDALNIKIPLDKEQVEKKIIEIVYKSDLKDRANVKTIITGGDSIGGIDFDPKASTFFIVGDKWQALPDEDYKNGTKLITYSYKREMPKLKTTNYIKAVSLQALKKEQGAIEILYIHDGEVLEGATSNFFLVKDNTIVTPDVDILEGVTRKIVLELADKNYKVERRKVYEEELKTADEAFITSSFRDIVPVVKVDDLVIGDGKVGKVSKDLMGRFAEYVSLQTI